MMTKEELLRKFGLDSRVGLVKCSVCGKTLKVPNMYAEKERAKLTPYCATTTILHVQWLIHHGWHVGSLEANPPHQFYCPDCFPKGTPEYSRRDYGADWCKQAEEWMNENDKRQ